MTHSDGPILAKKRLPLSPMKLVFQLETAVEIELSGEETSSNLAVPFLSRSRIDSVDVKQNKRQLKSINK